MDRRPVAFPSIGRPDHGGDRGREVLVCRDDLPDADLRGEKERFRIPPDVERQ